MPYCSILECKNDSRRKNLKNGGVSYHRFPKDGSVKEKWIDATGRPNWMPSKSSTICSEHFLEVDFFISNKGYRYTKPTAIPSMKIVKFFNQSQNVNVATADSSKRQSDSESSEFNSQPKKKSRLHKGFVDTHIVEQNFIQKGDEVIPVQFHLADSSVQFEGETVKNIDVTGGSNCSTPRKKKLKDQLRFCKGKIIKQGLKIKRLQSRNRRLKNKLNNIDELLLRLEEKFDSFLTNTLFKGNK